jgi:hypothetical protein
MTGAMEPLPEAQRGPAEQLLTSSSPPAATCGTTGRE